LQCVPGVPRVTGNATIKTVNIYRVDFFLSKTTNVIYLTLSLWGGDVDHNRQEHREYSVWLDS